MKIALFQMNISWENKENNYLHLEEKIVEIKKKKFELLLLPEMSFTGFSMDIKKIKESEEETLQFIKKISQKYGIAIGFGWVKDCGLKAENHYTIISCKGEIISDYTKIHPFSYSGEDKKIIRGEEIIFFSLNNIIFSSFICYDLRFPELFQIASRQANVIIIPANWPEKRREHWNCLLKARAIENQIYILAINCVGKIGDIYYSGDSCVINPNGEVLETAKDIERLLEFDLIDDVDCYRKEFPIKQDRREELYYNLYRETIK